MLLGDNMPLLGRKYIRPFFQAFRRKMFLFNVCRNQPIIGAAISISYGLFWYSAEKCFSLNVSWG